MTHSVRPCLKQSDIAGKNKPFIKKDDLVPGETKREEVSFGKDFSSWTAIGQVLDTWTAKRSHGDPKMHFLDKKTTLD